MDRFRQYLTLGAMVSMTAACAANGRSEWTSNEEPLPPLKQETSVVVRNNNWSDMVVYAVRRGQRVRLGMVTSMNEERLRIPTGMNVGSTAVQLMAEPIGSSARFATDPIYMNPGQRVELRIENQLSISSWSVW